MIEDHLWGRGVKDERVLRVMARVPREVFLPPERATDAYQDAPQQIGHGQTISQPYMVARMSELLRVAPGDRILEIGVGSGYQTAILLELGAQVYGVELIEALAMAADFRLQALGYENFSIEVRDGYFGHISAGPFDGILLAAAPEQMPEPLLAQLAPGGRLVAPVGPTHRQNLYVYRQGVQRVEQEMQFPVRFVPMRGRAESP